MSEYRVEVETAFEATHVLHVNATTKEAAAYAAFDTATDGGLVVKNVHPLAIRMDGAWVDLFARV